MEPLVQMHFFLVSFGHMIFSHGFENVIVLVLLVSIHD